MKIDFNTKTAHRDDDKYIKTKIKTYKDNITTNFYNKKGFKKYQKKKQILSFMHMKNITPKYFQKNVNM